MNKTFLITGVAGFIGSHLLDFFLKLDNKVIGIDNFLTGSKKNIEHNFNNDNFKFINHDVCEKIILEDKIDYILHFASPASPIDYLKYPIKTLQIGSEGTKNILDLAVKNNSVVVVASTSEVYGDPLIHPQPETYYGNVNPVGPRGVYDEAKRYLEAITTAYNNKFSVDTRILRLFNTYGPRMRKDDGRVIPTFINQSIKGEKFTVFGNGKQTRSFCYIDDTIKAIYKSLNINYTKPINIGNPDEYSLIELIEIIKKINPNESEIIYSDLPENDPKMRKPNIDLAKQLLNWSPKINIFDGLKNTFSYYNKFN